MKNEIIAVEVLSLIISLIVLYGNIFETVQRNKKRLVFSALIITNTIALICDCLSWMMDGDIAYATLNYVMSTVSMILTFPISALFILYIYAFISERREISFTPYKCIIAFALLVGVVMFIASTQGYIFRIEDGYYVDGEFYNIYLIANAVTLLCGFILICMSSKYLGKHDSIASFSYIIMPVVCMIINAVYPDFSMAYPAISVSFLLTYIMMQSDHEEALIKQERETSHQASHDELTGLLNRRAFSEDINRLTIDEPFGAIFCDVNCLKYTNDNYGHAAGDKLLCDFSNVLQKLFRRHEIYRISGDEFVVTLPKISREIFDLRIKALRAELEKFEFPIAAVGGAYGNEQEAIALLNQAETDMYNQKKMFYDKYPKYRR